MARNGSMMSGPTIHEQLLGRNWIASDIYPLLERDIQQPWSMMLCTYLVVALKKVQIWEILQLSG